MSTPLSMKFLCDHMLIRLGKWLRTAGYDTAIITDPLSDQEVLCIALQEGRLLLTRDKHFLQMKQGNAFILYLKSNEWLSCIQELSLQLPINWLFNPFSRCLICNTVLTEPNAAVVNNQVSVDIRERTSQFWYCPHCQKVYWIGSHTKRMMQQLRYWQDSFCTNSGRWD